MDTAEICKLRIGSPSQNVENTWDDELQQLAQTLPKEEAWISGVKFYLYQGFWCTALALKPVVSFQKHFRAFDSDVIIATFPKCGTTWLKALTFSTLYRNQFAMDQHPLLTFTPHQLVRFFEYDVYLDNPCPDLESMCVYKPRVFSTHVPYASLPSSVKDSHYKLRDESKELLSLDEAFDKFCNGVYIKEDTGSQLKRLAMFLGVPFTEDEEMQGVVEEITNICSFESLKDLEVNKKGLHVSGISHKDFFRKGKVGDWSNYLTPSMVERMEKLAQEKLEDSGLTFNLSSKTSNA
ncbi:hypothetical protein F3Y22_tig00110258pilonHSYRG00186 [Hibiscus syriacus]|uniref:Sulfotransferase n=1 Tax=Hibiscus syriacus TaxID=106335 RepID=A0A6A3B9H4_HIBSY|nr:hypothetical protein F3Y22_tig00110258pilonHSYRG00186 [Hibiscus syriacus]